MHVQISLSENVLQALVVSEDMNYIPQKIMPPCSQGKDNSSQLKIMCRIVLLMTANFSSFFRRSVMGLAILKKFRMNL
jgi:hypothetical protein